MIWSETGFAEGLEWLRKVQFGLSLLFQMFLPEANGFGVREESSDSLSYICLSISGAALLPEHEDIRLAIPDSDTRHSARSMQTSYVYLLVSFWHKRSIIISNLACELFM